MMDESDTAMFIIQEPTRIVQEPVYHPGRLRARYERI